MTKTLKTAKPADAELETGARFAAIKDAFESVRGQIEIPAAAREFVQRAAANAKERAEQVHGGATSVTGTVEMTVNSLIGGYANLVRGVMDVTHANVVHYLATVEKVAQAPTLADAVQIQADFVRESAKANYDRAASAAVSVRDFVAAKVEAVRGDYARFVPGFARAA